MICRSLLATLFVLFATMVAKAAEDETANHQMAAGNFGVAWISGSNIMWTPNGQGTPQVLVSGANASQIVAANLNANGQDLVYASGGALYYHTFSNNTNSGPYGNGITDIAAGTFAPGNPYEQVFLGTGIGAFSFSGQTNSFTGEPGSFNLVTAGHFTASNYTQFSVVNSGNQAFIFDPNTSTYLAPTPYGVTFTSQIAGNLTGGSQNDIWLTNTAGALEIASNPVGSPSFQLAGGVAGSNLALAIGNIDGLGEKGFVLGSDNSTIYQYDLVHGFNDTFATNPHGWQNFIFDQIGGKEVMFAISNANGLLYRLDMQYPGGPTFILASVPEPSSFILCGLGAVGLLVAARRRKA